jgi:hypothetical protein
MKKRMNSRSKGSRFERAIAKDFSKWCGFTCKRTPMSGGWAKTGDVTPKRPKDMVEFIFCAELKHQEGWSFSNSFLGKSPNKQIAKWWGQCQADAKKSDRIPILIFTKNFDQIYCMCETSFFRKAKLKEVATILISIPKFRIFLWDDFRKIPYSEIKKRSGGSL